MKLHAPFEITPRLLPGLRVGDGWLSLEHVGQDGDGRMVYRWYADIPAGEFSEADLKSGCQGGGLQEMFGSLLAFLGKTGEAYWYQSRTGDKSENADLFPPEVVEWAHQHSDLLATLQTDIGESGAVLIEA